ncbi:hypothetical protein ACFXAF_00125 [Kitasatospora sp. NPDC059463]|uniref:hypothetical protein n=1 Tax=unclassified Kitasatospora TaxID=2633591 RepID=UPI0036B4E02B
MRSQPRQQKRRLIHLAAVAISALLIRFSGRASPAQPQPVASPDRLPPTPCDHNDRPHTPGEEAAIPKKFIEAVAANLPGPRLWRLAPCVPCGGRRALVAPGLAYPDVNGNYVTLLSCRAHHERFLTAIFEIKDLANRSERTVQPRAREAVRT